MDKVPKKKTVSVAVPSFVDKCTPWFSSAWSSSEQSGLALHLQIQDDLTYLGT